MYIHVLHTCMHTYIKADTYTCMSVYTCVHMHMPTYIYIYIHKHTYTHKHYHTYIHIHIYAHTHIHTCLFAHIYTHMYKTHMHAYTHTHKHTTHLSFSCGAPRGGRGSDHRNTGAAIIYSRKTPRVKVLIDPFAPRVRKGWTLLHWTLRPFSLFRWVSPCQSAPAVLLSISYTDTLLSLKPSGRLGRSQLD